MSNSGKQGEPTATVGGILRKQPSKRGPHTIHSECSSSNSSASHTNNCNVNNNFDDLLIFGYACKLFRDDERALFLDQGRHLIPWMNDDSLKIDRYDGRGALSDLRPYERCSATAGAGHTHLSECERRVEELCNEERYYSLANHEVDDSGEQEEEEEALKRHRTNTFAYNYDEDGASTTSAAAESSVEKPPPPPTEEMAFTPPEHLHPLPPNIMPPSTMREHVRIEKTARFVCEHGTQMEILIKTKQQANRNFDFMTLGAPLHPYYRHVLTLLKNGQYPVEEATTAAEENESHQPSMEYNNSCDASSQAPSTVHPLAAGKHEEEVEKQQQQQQQQSYYDYYYGVQYYEYYQQYNAQLYPQLQRTGPSSTGEFPFDVDEKGASGAVAAPSSGGHTEALSKQGSFLSRLVDDYGSSSRSSSSSGGEDNEIDTKNCVEAAAVAPPPPDETAAIITKMASYVAKNGAEFEAIVMSKGDTRFEFLRATHKYHTYYTRKLREFKGAAATPPPQQQLPTSPATPTPTPPVSFSIQRRRQADEVVGTGNALQEEEEEEEDGAEDNSSPPLPRTPPPAQPPPPPSPSPPPPADDSDPILEVIDLSQVEKDPSSMDGTTTTTKSALQLERKRKLAAFLRLKAHEQRASSSSSTSGPAKPTTSVEEKRSGKHKEAAHKRRKSHSRHKLKRRRRRSSPSPTTSLCSTMPSNTK